MVQTPPATREVERDRSRETSREELTMALSSVAPLPTYYVFISLVFMLIKLLTYRYVLLVGKSNSRLTISPSSSFIITFILSYVSYYCAFQYCYVEKTQSLKSNDD